MRMARPVVDTALGRLEGVTRAGADAFLGIPYARPPVGDLRFAPAQPPTPWNGTRNASSYGAPCYQTAGVWEQDPNEHPDPSAPKPSEDCLFINIFRPSRVAQADVVGAVVTHAPAFAAGAPASAELLPVMVWIHGGGFCTGAGSSAWSNASRLASEHRVLVATLNYRLGPLGFLALPSLKAAYGASGGLNGVRDQLTALRWVRSHIGAFGGDASRVTVFGESSGGVATCVLDASPLANGLFHRAVVQSGPCIVPGEGWGPASEAEGIRRGVALGMSLGAPDLRSLRALPPQRLQWDNATLASDDDFSARDRVEIEIFRRDRGRDARPRSRRCLGRGTRSTASYSPRRRLRHTLMVAVTRRRCS